MTRSIKISLGTNSIRISLKVAIYMAVTCLLLVANLVNGSHVFITTCLAAIAMISVMPLTRSKILVSDVLIFSFGIYCGFATLAIKAVILQPIQQNLLFPMDAAVNILLGFLTILSASEAARHLIGSKSSKLSRIANDKEFQARAVLPLLVFGLVTRYFHTLWTRGGGSEVSGFGGFGSFYPILIYAITVQFSHMHTKTTASRALLVLTAASILYMSSLSNAKRDMMDLIFIAIIFIFAFGMRIRLSYILFGGAVLAFLMLIVSPALHVIRGEGLAAAERIPRMIELVTEAGFSPAILAAQEASFFQGFEYSYAENASHVYPAALNVDRFSHVFTMDQVIRGVEAKGYMGFDIFLQKAAELVLPSMLIAKDGVSSTDLLAWEYGIRRHGSVARPVIGVIASAFSAGGLLAMIPTLFTLGVVFFTSVNYFFGPVRQSVFGVLGCTVLILIPEKQFEMLIAFPLRDLVSIWILFFLASHMLRYRLRLR